MALVGYSDSEDSDSRTTQQVPAVAKRIERSTANKIKVDLTPLQHGSIERPTEPPAKRQKTGGAFSGFNSLLPAPKRTVQSSMKPGLSLRTSSEAAFSRAPPSSLTDVHAEAGEASQATSTTAVQEEMPEPVLVGKPTRFMPLSVARSKKRKPPVSVPVPVPQQSKIDKGETAASDKPKIKQSLFSMGEGDDVTASTAPYEPEFVHLSQSLQTSKYSDLQAIAPPQTSALDSAATDLDLSESDLRRLFGRSGKQGDVKFTHFDMEAEYQSNQELAARGDVVEHRTVRAIAPGRHSLQQLVNNVQGQTEAIEDKWAEGRRARGETGSKYGW